MSVQPDMNYTKALAHTQPCTHVPFPAHKGLLISDKTGLVLWEALRELSGHSD